jgi:hypothetical protein
LADIVESECAVLDVLVDTTTNPLLANTFDKPQIARIWTLSGFAGGYGPPLTGSEPVTTPRDLPAASGGRVS